MKRRLSEQALAATDSFLEAYLALEVGLNRRNGHLASVPCTLLVFNMERPQWMLSVGLSVLEPKRFTNC